MENSVYIKIANLAVNLNCNIIMDEQGDICLLQKFYDEEGVKIVRFAPSPYNYYTQENWLARIKNGEGRNFIC